MKNPVKDHLGEKFKYISRLTVILTLFIMACFTPIISTVEALCGSSYAPCMECYLISM